MRISTKQTAGLFLLLLVSIPLLYIMFFIYRQQMIRHEMKERLEKQMLQTITINEKDVHWIKKGKEILVNAKMFDIESFTYHDSFISFTGLYDEDETNLVNKLDELQKKNPASNNQSLVQLFKCLHTIFCSPANDICFLSDQREYLISFTFPKLLNQFIVIPLPPPEA